MTKQTSTYKAKFRPDFVTIIFNHRISVINSLPPATMVRVNRLMWGMAVAQEQKSAVV